MARGWYKFSPIALLLSNGVIFSTDILSKIKRIILKLKVIRNVSFVQIVMHIERGGLIDIIEHLNNQKYTNQKILIVNINEYIFLVSCVEQNNERVLKTI